MKPRISPMTLCVDDLERALRFYRDGLGLATEGIIGGEYEYGAVVFFNLQAHLKLALYPRKSGARCGLTTGKTQRSGTQHQQHRGVQSRSRFAT